MGQKIERNQSRPVNLFDNFIIINNKRFFFFTRIIKGLNLAKFIFSKKSFTLFGT